MCIRAYIMETIAGPTCINLTCRQCGVSLTYDTAEIHHMNGRDWPMSWPQEKRAKRMLAELEAGVWLALLCKSCNSSIGDPRSKEAA